MPMFEENDSVLACQCGHRSHYKKDIYTYVKSGKDRLTESLVETKILCNYCNDTVKIIRPSGAEKII